MIPSMHDADEASTDASTTAPAPSKTRRKQAMHALQALGEALVALDPRRIDELALPERLVDALAQARGIRAHEGRRRQMQYIGKLMRDIDPAPVEAALARWSSGLREDNARFAAIEDWREQLVRDDAAIERFLLARPGADRQALLSLVREARDERKRGAPPHRYRALFRAIRAELDDAPGT